MNIVMNRKEILEQLANRLEAAKREDERLAKAHHVDEAKALEKFRGKLRAAIRCDYAQARKLSYNGLDLDRPTCPSLNAPRIQRIIAGVKLDRRDSYNFLESSDIGQAVMWKPERDKQTVCD